MQTENNTPERAFVQVNSAFSKDIEGLQVAWDSTSLGNLKTCPRKYYYQHVLNYIPRGESVHLIFGQIFHTAIETYDKAKAKGADHEESVQASVMSIIQTGVRDSEGKWAPWNFDDPNKNRSTLIRSVVWYFDKFKDDPAKTIILDNGKPAVELSFRFGIQKEAPDGQEYLLCGHLDRVVEFGSEVFVMDHKTTKGALTSHYFDQFSPNNQMSLYTLAGNVISLRAAKGVIIDAVQLLVGGSRFARNFANRTKGQLDEWLNGTMRWIGLAEKFAQEQYWPMNDTACDKFGGCPFRGICAADPKVRKLYLDSDFDKRVWDPLQSR